MKTNILKQLTPKQQLTSALLLMTLPLLSGCSIMGVYEGSFDCPAGKGVGCKSISQVNDMINQGTLLESSQDDFEDTLEEYPQGYPQSASVHPEWGSNSSCGNTYQQRPEAESNSSCSDTYQQYSEAELGDYPLYRSEDSSDDNLLNHFTDRSPNNFEHRHDSSWKPQSQNDSQNNGAPQGPQGLCGRCTVRTPSSWQDEIWWSDALEEEPIPLWVEDEVGA